MILNGFFFFWFGFLTSSSTTRLYRAQAPRQSVSQFYVLPHMRQSGKTMTSVSAGHIILTTTQPVGSGGPQQELNPGPSHQESRALPTELLRPPMNGKEKVIQDVKDTLYMLASDILVLPYYTCRSMYSH